MDLKPITDFIRYLRFTDGLSSSDVIGWILAALAGIIAYRLIDNMQMSIERHNMLSTIEDAVSGLFDSQIAFSMPKGEIPSDDTADKFRVMVRSVLHDGSDWKFILSSDNPQKVDIRIADHQRYVHIRNDAKYNEWISTQALHEISLKMRRIEKMYKGGIVRRIDLSDMFREIIPLGMSGRLEFFRSYYGDYDAECLAYLIMQTVVSCHKYHNDEIVKEFAGYFRKHEEIWPLFYKNRRILKFRDAFALHRFRKLMEG
ncbi:MAG: hypothetical protein J6P45_07485 [Lachnospiraceae bacterium]|nr:hypothetical protein [Lachnospiraceae bacterium]